MPFAVPLLLLAVTTTPAPLVAKPVPPVGIRAAHMRVNHACATELRREHDGGRCGGDWRDGGGPAPSVVIVVVNAPVNGDVVIAPGPVLRALPERTLSPARRELGASTRLAPRR